MRAGIRIEELKNELGWSSVTYLQNRLSISWVRQNPRPGNGVRKTMILPSASDSAIRSWCYWPFLQMCFGKMAHEVFKNCIEHLWRKNCERVLIITYCLCKNVLRVCRKEASPLTEPSPFCTSNQTGGRNDVCLVFFFHLAVLNPINLDTLTWKWMTVVNHHWWHITYEVQLLSQCFVCGQHTDWLRSMHSGNLVWSQDKSKIPGCAEEVQSCSGREWDVRPLCTCYSVRFDQSALRVRLCNQMLP